MTKDVLNKHVYKSLLCLTHSNAPIIARIRPPPHPWWSNFPPQRSWNSFSLCFFFFFIQLQSCSVSAPSRSINQKIYHVLQETTTNKRRVVTVVEVLLITFLRSHQQAFECPHSNFIFLLLFQTFMKHCEQLNWMPLFIWGLVLMIIKFYTSQRVTAGLQWEGDT